MSRKCVDLKMYRYCNFHKYHLCFSDKEVLSNVDRKCLKFMIDLSVAEDDAFTTECTHQIDKDQRTYNFGNALQKHFKRHFVENIF